MPPRPARKRRPTKARAKRAATSPVKASTKATAAPSMKRASPGASAARGAKSAATEVALGEVGTGLLVMPETARWLYVLAHGAGAGMRHAFMEAIAGALAARDVATLRWEFPYMAAGKARTDTPAVAEAAVRAAWTASAEHARGMPRFAGGKSFGGRMTSRSHATQALPELAGLVFLGFPLHPPDKPGIERADHLAATAPAPLLFLQGDRDDLADLALLRPVVADLGARATLAVIDHADHGFEVLVRSGRTNAEVLDELAATIAAWMAARA
jgi:predicted alpha/beta-hydrolase family hydrolase